ncbi:MAG: hypothetical protein IKP76_01260 [Bacilli bacterium]|nr:hypothetical protein [Bacilli bacterium]
MKEKSIIAFNKNKKYVDKLMILELSKYLDIHFKENSKSFIDLKMINNVSNKKIKIINISKFDIKGDLSTITRQVNNKSRKLYTSNNPGYTIVLIKDCNILVEIGKLGIDKTFCRKVPYIKLPSYNRLKELVENGVYYKSTYNPISKDGIIYHHFLVPVKIIKHKENYIVRYVIKEYTKNPILNSKFYYHQIEFFK